MKIAILSDIHSNLPALQSVLNDMPIVDGVICCGDVVGYYPDVNEVCSKLRDIEAFVIRGNHDAYVLGELNPDPTKRFVCRIDWTRSKISSSHRDWLYGLPTELRFHWNNLSVTVRHANPWDEETYIYPDSPELAKISLYKNEILILGHTHHPVLIKRQSEGILINPGSVGQPRDRNPKASYMILQTETKSIENLRVVYDVDEFQRRLKALNWEESSINILNRQESVK